MTTSAVTLIDRIAATIAHYKKYLCINEEKDRVSHQVHEQALNAQAANWTREPLTCTKHNEPMFQIIFKTPEHEKGEWICHSCQDEKLLAWKEYERTTERESFSSSPFYKPGNIFRPVLSTQQGYEEEVSKLALSKLSTLPRSTGEIPQIVKEMIPQANVPTIPLPARDIVYEVTPPDDSEKTLPRIRAISRSTKQIPVIGAEIILMSIKNGPTSPQDTGAQQKINEDAFLL